MAPQAHPCRRPMSELFLCQDLLPGRPRDADIWASGRPELPDKIGLCSRKQTVTIAGAHEALNRSMHGPTQGHGSSLWVSGKG